MTTAQRHIFIRHPPLPQMRGLCYGRLDIALAPQVFADAVAELQAIPDSERLWRLPILSSPAQRCSGLAQACARIGAGGTRHTPRVDSRLLEMNFGMWEGTPWSDLPRAHLDRWAEDVAGFRPPDGECFNDLIHRVGIALAELSEPHLIVTHAGVVRAAMHLLGGMDPVAAAGIQIAHLQPIEISAMATAAH
jgi:alpha-ribazole phosphatase